jgi:hypothetical protein
MLKGEGRGKREGMGKGEARGVHSKRENLEDLNGPSTHLKIKIIKNK